MEVLYNIRKVEHMLSINYLHKQKPLMHTGINPYFVAYHSQELDTFFRSTRNQLVGLVA